jgi:pimeloyl-ACP methyl ester carboxylesterase
MRKTYIDGRWGQVHVRMAGSGTPLVLLHQSPLSGDQFSPAIPLLAEAGFQVIAPDMPGYGGSDAPPRVGSIPEHAEALVMLLDALGLEQVHLLGHHTGASIAACLAAGPHRARVSKLILNGIALLSPEERAHFATFKFAPLEPQPDGSHLLAAWNQRLRASPGWTDLEAMHRHCVTMLANPARYYWAFEGVFAHDTLADLKAIEAPTLVFTNTGEDLYDACRRAADLRADWDFAALEGGTHDIVDEQPEAWAAAVAAWLRG